MEDYDEIENMGREHVYGFAQDPILDDIRNDIF